MVERTGAPGGDSPAELIMKSVRNLSRAVGELQGSAVVLQFVLTELLADTALTQQDPRRYLADMFERISVRMDETAPEAEQRPDSEARQLLQILFGSVTNRLQPDQ